MIKVEEKVGALPRRFKQGDLVQDVQSPEFVYLLGQESNGKHRFTTLRGCVDAPYVSFGEEDFSARPHQLFEGKIILENA